MRAHALEPGWHEPWGEEEIYNYFSPLPPARIDGASTAVNEDFRFGTLTGTARLRAEEGDQEPHVVGGIVLTLSGEVFAAQQFDPPVTLPGPGAELVCPLEVFITGAVPDATPSL